MPRHVAIIWDYYQHYHLARLKALQAEGAASGWTVTAYSAGRYGAVSGSHRIAVAGGDAVPVELGGENDDINSQRSTDALLARLDVGPVAAVMIPGYGFRLSQAALRWCRRARRGAVVMFESQERDLPRTWWKEAAKKWLLRAADSAFCGGKSHAAYAAKLGIPAERIFQGYSCVDNEFWREAAREARQRPRPVPAPYLISVGRFIAKKNLAGLVEAFAAFKVSGGNDWKLVLVGDGPERGAIEAAALRGRVTDSVLLPGYADAVQTAEWLAHAEGFVLPSSHAEQWGLVVNEAMAAGVPVIASDICGCAPDLIDHDRTGWTFDPQQPDELLNALRLLAASPAKREAVAREASVRIDDFSLERFAREALAACDCAIGHASRRGRVFD